MQQKEKMMKAQKLNKYERTKFQMMKMEKLMMTTSVTIHNNKALKKKKIVMKLFITSHYKNQ